LRKIIDEPSGAPQILRKAPEHKHHKELQEFYFGIWGYRPGLDIVACGHLSGFYQIKI